MLRGVAFVRTDVLEEHIASTFTGTRVYTLGRTLAVTSNRGTLRRNTATANVRSSPNRVTLKMEAMLSSETLVLTRAIRRHIPEDGILRVTAVNTSYLT
jgi:hypothetical protein